VACSFSFSFSCAISELFLLFFVETSVFLTSSFVRVRILSLFSWSCFILIFFNELSSSFNINICSLSSWSCSTSAASLTFLSNIWFSKYLTTSLESFKLFKLTSCESYCWRVFLPSWIWSLNLLRSSSFILIWSWSSVIFSTFAFNSHDVKVLLLLDFWSFWLNASNSTRSFWRSCSIFAWHFLASWRWYLIWHWLDIQSFHLTSSCSFLLAPVEDKVLLMLFCLVLSKSSLNLFSSASVFSVFLCITAFWRFMFISSLDNSACLLRSFFCNCLTSISFCFFQFMCLELSSFIFLINLTRFCFNDWMSPFICTIFLSFWTLILTSFSFSLLSTWSSLILASKDWICCLLWSANFLFLFFALASILIWRFCFSRSSLRICSSRFLTWFSYFDFSSLISSLFPIFVTICSFIEIALDNSSSWTCISWLLFRCLCFSSSVILNNSLFSVLLFSFSSELS